LTNLLRINIYIVIPSIPRSCQEGWVLVMRSANLEMIEKLRMIALKRCEGRIADAAKKSGKMPKKKDAVPQYGVSSLVKAKHGLL